MQIFFNIDSINLQSGNLFIMRTGHLDNLFTTGLYSRLLKGKVEMQQYLLNMFFKDDINAFQTSYIAACIACSRQRKYLHFRIREQNPLHLNQNLTHNIALFRIVQNVIVGMEGLLIVDIFQYGSLAVTRGYNIEVQILNLRNVTINLR